MDIKIHPGTLSQCKNNKMKEIEYKPGTTLNELIKKTNSIELAEQIYNAIKMLLPGDKLNITVEIKQTKIKQNE